MNLIERESLPWGVCERPAGVASSCRCQKNEGINQNLSNKFNNVNQMSSTFAFAMRNHSVWDTEIFISWNGGERGKERGKGDLKEDDAPLITNLAEYRQEVLTSLSPSPSLAHTSYTHAHLLCSTFSLACFLSNFLLSNPITLSLSLSQILNEFFFSLLSLSLALFLSFSITRERSAS